MISNPLNAAILSAVIGGESYPRELALKLGMRESHVSERLKVLERHGLIKGRWKTIAARGKKKNAKIFSSTVSALKIDLGASGLKLELKRKGKSYELHKPIYEFRIPDVASFIIGREPEMELMGKARAGLIVVSGIAGIGKTTLVSKFASRSRKTAVFWHDLRESDSLRYVIAKSAAFLSGFGNRELIKLIDSNAAEEEVLIDRAAREFERLGHALIVFDDYHFCKDKSITHLLQRLGRSKILRTVVVSRFRPTELYASGRVSEVTLSGHTVAEAAELFKANDIRLASEEVRKINGRVKGHPLALNLMCTAAKLKGARAALETAVAGLRDYVLKWLEDAMAPIELETLRCISVFRGPVSLDAFHAVTRVEKREDLFTHRIAVFERLGVVTRLGEGFVVHDLVRDVLSNSSEASHRRAAAYYQSKGDARSSLEALYHHIIGGQQNEAVQILKESVKLVDEGYLEPLLHLTEEMLANTVNEDKRLRGWILQTKAYTFQRMNTQLDLAAKHLKEAEAIGREYGDGALVARALLFNGYILRDKGNIRRAEPEYKAGLEVPHIGSEDPVTAGLLTDGLADAMMWNGRISEAIRLESQAIEIYKRAGDARDVAGATLGLGVYYYMKGEFQKSLSLLANAEIPLGNKNLTALAESARGLVLERLGKRYEALEHLNRAIKIIEDTSDRLVLLELLSERMILMIKLGKTREAKKELPMAQKQHTERRYSLGVLKLAEGALQIVDGRYSEAESCFERAGQLLSADSVSVGRVLWWKGLTRALRGDDSASKKLLFEAKNKFEKIGATGYAKQVESVAANTAQIKPREAIALAW